MKSEYIAIDFETTGLDAKKCEVVEIGAVRFREDGEILDNFQSLAKPRKLIPMEAVNVHGISNIMVKDMESPRAVWDKFLAWAGEFTALVAHNAEFESLFIQEMYKQGEALPDLKIIDTLSLSKKRLAGLASYKLTDIVGSLGEDSHRALPDANACIQVFLRSAKTYKSGKIPHATYLLPVWSYKYVDPYAPTTRQLAYIESLGGNPSKVTTRKEASEYIDRLKSGDTKKFSSPAHQNIFSEAPAINSHSPQKPYFQTIPGQIVKVLLIFAAIVVGWIAVLS